MIAQEPFADTWFAVEPLERLHRARRVITCVRAWLHGWDRQRVEETVYDDRAGGFLIEDARRQGVFPVVAHALLHQPGAPACSPTIQARIDALRERIVFDQLRHTAVLQEVTSALLSAGIEPLVLKGLALAESLYGGLPLRGPVQDIDLLIERSRAGQARCILRELGFHDQADLPAFMALWPQDRYGQAWFGRDTDHAAVELHTGLSLPGMAACRRWGDVWEASQAITIAGRTYRGLGSDDLVLFQAMNVGKDAYQDLKGILDFALAVHRPAALETDRLLRLARRLGIRRSLGLSLAVGERLFLVSVPEGLRTGLRLERYHRQARAVVGWLLRTEPGARAVRLGSQLDRVHDRWFWRWSYSLRPTLAEWQDWPVRREEDAWRYQWYRPWRLLVRRLRGQTGDTAGHQSITR